MARNELKRAERAAAFLCKYNPLNLICASHNVKFVKFECLYKGYGHYSNTHGCPVCVGLIRARVQYEFKRYKLHLGWKSSNAQTKRGRPKTKTVTTIVETRNGI